MRRFAYCFVFGLLMCSSGQALAEEAPPEATPEAPPEATPEATPAANSITDILIVVGADGASEYAEPFDQAATTWMATCERAGLSLLQIKDSGNTTQYDALRDTLAKIATAESSRPLWLVLVGHGTWDGKTANFNLSGPDVSARQLAEWIDPIKRPLAVLNCASCSGPFVNRLSREGRVVVTATKSGSEQNATRFATYVAKAIGNVSADLDHDDEVSVREAYLKAVADLEAFYREQGRLASEHALLDDNGDGKGSNYKMLRGKAAAKSGAVIDGLLAAKISIPATSSPLQLSASQRKQRDELERQLETLKKTLKADQDELRTQATVVLEKLAAIYAAAEDDSKETAPPKQDDSQ